jgi:hypothetical protein
MTPSRGTAIVICLKYNLTSSSVLGSPLSNLSPIKFDELVCPIDELVCPYEKCDPELRNSDRNPTPK